MFVHRLTDVQIHHLISIVAHIGLADDIFDASEASYLSMIKGEAGPVADQPTMDIGEGDISVFPNKVSQIILLSELSIFVHVDGKMSKKEAKIIDRIKAELNLKPKEIRSIESQAKKVAQAYVGIRKMLAP